MISYYRLGDLYYQPLPQTDIDNLIKHNPNSIGSTYIIEKQKNSNLNKLDLITNITNDFLNKNIHLLPQDISDAVVVHLRLGDVIAGNEWHEKAKRPLDIKHLKSLVENYNNDKIYIIGKPHFGDTCSNNIDECIELSNKYLEDVIRELNATHLDLGSPDLDLCCGIKSKLFIQGRGFYSKLIVEIRKKLKLPNIETNTYLL